MVSFFVFSRGVAKECVILERTESVDVAPGWVWQSLKTWAILTLSQLLLYSNPLTPHKRRKWGRGEVIAMKDPRW